MAAFELSIAHFPGPAIRNCSVGQVLYFFGAWHDPCVLWSVPQPQCRSFSLSLVAGLDFLQH